MTAISLVGPPTPEEAEASEPSGGSAESHRKSPVGTASLLHKYVQTARLSLEQSAGRALFGSYRNQYTDSPLVQNQDIDRTVSNTNVMFWRGQLLAMKEDGLPVALDPETLETRKQGWDFEGQLGGNKTFTAHPKLVPKRSSGTRTGNSNSGGTERRNGAQANGNTEKDREGGQEMVCFAYEAGPLAGLCSVDCVVWTIDEGTGRKLGERWFKAPFAGMIHDCGVSENYVVLPLTPLKMDLERMKAGGEKFAWDPEEDQWYGVVPRDDKQGGVVWFRADNGMSLSLV